MSWNVRSWIYFHSIVSHAPHGACELKCVVEIIHYVYPRHAPHGACELKFISCSLFLNQSQSRSPRSVWVEIKNNLEQYLFLTCHAPHGACELKYCLSVVKYYYVLCHAPHGACELKLYFLKSIYIFPCHAPHGACELKCYANSKRDLRVLVTLPTERVSWNNNSIAIYMQKPGHAPHGACEWGRRGAILYKIVITENRG